MYGKFAAKNIILNHKYFVCNDFAFYHPIQAQNDILILSKRLNHLQFGKAVCLKISGMLFSYQHFLRFVKVTVKTVHFVLLVSRLHVFKKVRCHYLIDSGVAELACLSLRSFPSLDMTR